MRNASPLLILLSIILIFGLQGCTEKTDELTKNVLFISVDDLRPDLGCYENPFISTPNIDRFANKGIVFTRAYCQSAVCAPSRASLMLGLYPDSTRVWHLGDQFRKINPQAVTMPQYFHSQGFYTVSIGKIFHNYMPDSISWDEPDLRPYPYGEEENLLRDGETFYAGTLAQEVQKNRRDSIGKIRKVVYADGWNCGPVIEAVDVEDDEYIDGAQTTLAIATLKRLKEKQPFYLAVGYYRPHLPFAAPKKYWDLYDRMEIPLPDNPRRPQNSPVFSMNSMYELRAYEGTQNVPHPVDGALSEESTRLLKHGYYASVSYVDACIGRLLDACEDEGLMQSTVVIVWGDHGWKLGDMGSWGKMTNYHIDTRVPLIIGGAFPGQSKNDQVNCNALVELVDIFPTLCDLSGIPLPGYLDGQSMLPLINDPDIEWKEAAFSQFHRRPKVSYDKGRYMGYSIQTKDYHMIEWYHWDNENKVSTDSITTEFYDHRNDPYETRNVIDQTEYQEEIKNLHMQILQHFPKTIN